MKRRAIKLIVFLLAGAIINVAVAWGCALWSEANPRTLKLLSPDRARQMVQESFDDWSDEGLDEIQGSELHGVGVRRTQVISMHPPDRFYQSFGEWSGLPAISLFGQRLGTEERDSTNGGWMLPGLWTNRLPGFNGTLLPYQTVWPGFAINTIFYAAVLWVLFAIPGAVRRRVRRKRGQCAACGYSLRDIRSEKCPECGCSTPSPAGRGQG